MRNNFSSTIFDIFKNNNKAVFVTGDLGFNALEKIQSEFDDRFINVGVAEQSMIGIAAGISYNGFQTFCYSIAPFAVFRCLEQIKIDVCIHNLPICIVGNGGGYGYGIMGATHHALEDIGCLSLMPNMTCWIPAFQEDVEYCLSQIIKYRKPSYLRLGLGKPYPKKNKISSINQIVNANNPDITVVVLGPLVHNAIDAIQEMDNVNLFTVLSIPFIEEPEILLESISITSRLIVIEEHVKRGGLGEYLLTYLNDNNIQLKTFSSMCAKGYPSKTYGSQSFHQTESGLDPISIKCEINKVLKR